ncbi:hypothetical protein SBA4_750025 [Candidatus Sulfopaludibacter sp. SbA4]|nr:hypothetical protein SBA4_750025 [Candidatus Sulfopaludibacter sp. SbA4]
MVEPELYGAARMLKDAGTDRFSVPRQLREFDAEQIENFTRIYQEHAVVAAHHVAQTAFLEQYLEQRHWSAALDDTLAAELPWSIERFEKMRSAARRVPEHLEGLDRARAIGESTPFRETWALATLARLALEDWTACNEAAQCLVTTDETILWEAALALSHWRVLRGPGSPADRRQLLDALRRCPLKEPAALRLALLGEPGGGPLPPEDFGAALVTGDVARLSTAAHEGDPLMQFAAAQRLIELDAAAPAAGVLRSATPDRQLALLRLLERRKRPVPELKEALFEVAANAQERQVVDGAVRGLRCGRRPADRARGPGRPGGLPGVVAARGHAGTGARTIRRIPDCRRSVSRESVGHEGRCQGRPHARRLRGAPLAKCGDRNARRAVPVCRDAARRVWR